MNLEQLSKIKMESGRLWQDHEHLYIVREPELQRFNLDENYMW